VADVDALATVDERDFRSGLAEVAKYALTLDEDLLARLERDTGPIVRRDAAVLEDVIARCVAAKAGVVAEDERDASARLVLNYGHTLGHALERLDAFRGRTHGEAVALGMVFAAALAEARGLAPGLRARTERLLGSLGYAPDGELPPVDEVVRCISVD
jgi:3-dehydroquinate synthase